MHNCGKKITKTSEAYNFNYRCFGVVFFPFSVYLNELYVVLDLSDLILQVGGLEQNLLSYCSI